MKLITGLGNPGVKFVGSRHNTGFYVIEHLAQKLGLTNWEENQKMSADIVKNTNLILAKPRTFMNLSGDAVETIVKFYKVDLNDLYIIHDDLDICLGNHKIQLGTGPKIHNGLESIYEKLGNKKFWHVRVGIDNRDPGNRQQGEVYVLQHFTPEEYTVLQNVTSGIVDELFDIL